MAYSIPDFAGSGGSSEMTRPFQVDQIDFGSLGGMSSTQNQHMNFPSMTAPNTPPGVVPPAGGGSTPPFGWNPAAGFNLGDPAIGGKHKLGGGATTEPTLDPGFTTQLYQWLQGQLGKGVTPFNLQAGLPSTGGATLPGQLSAPLTPELQQLAQFLQTGQGGSPGEQQLGAFATQSGLPTDVLPQWQAMIAAEQQNIDKGAANVREQFAGLGDLQSSPFGFAVSDYFKQAQLGENALLTQAETGSLEAARGRQLGAAQDLTQLGTGVGEYLQGLDQQSIDRLVQEFIRTQPEYSPLLGEEAGLSTTFSPLYGHTGFGAAFGSNFGAGLGGGLAKLITG